MNKKILIAALAVSGAILIYAKRRKKKPAVESPESTGRRKRHLTNTFARSKNYSQEKPAV